MSRNSQLNAFRLDAAKDGFLEASWTAEKLVLGWGHGELMQKLLLNQAGRANQVGNLEKFVSGRFNPLRKLNGRQKARRENAMKQVGDWSLTAIVVDLDAVEFPQFGMTAPEGRKLPLDFVHNLFGRINELLIDDECMVLEVSFTHKTHHQREYLCAKFPTQNGKFVSLPDDGAGVKAHSLDSKSPYASIKFIGQGVNHRRLIVKNHREKIEARGGVRLMQHPRFVYKNAQYSLAQSASPENISDGNCFSSLKAKNILRFSVIPSFRKTSVNIISYFLRKRKGKMISVISMK